MTAPPARPRIAPRWSFPPPPDEQRVAQLSRELNLPPIVARLLVSRGFAATDDARRYLRPRLDQLHDPLLLTGMGAAVDRLCRAVRGGELVIVHGDYDVDGMCATTILVRTLHYLGGNARPFIPHRLRDGYDLGQAGVRAALDAGAGVLVTCDCGTSAHTAVQALADAGVDVIISDHHLPSTPPPACLAVLNPRVPGANYPDRDLCAAGVAFKLAVALLGAMGGTVNFAYHMLDLVALATVADVAPLRGENRVMVRYGLKLMAETSHAGLRALLMSSGLDARAITAGRISFVLAPRLNAVGRIASGMRGVELLLSEDAASANAIARELEELNHVRQGMDRETFAEARDMLEREDDDRVGIVLASERWHAGVIGIVASRLVEEYHRPAVLVAVQDGVGKGSGRSIPAFDLHAGLTACRETLLRYGGHRAAAGVTVDPARLPEFSARFDAVARERLSPDDLVPTLRVDLELPLADVTADVEALLRHFEPFGIGNPAPLLASRGARLARPPRVIGQDGLKLCLTTPAGELDAVWWGAAERAAELAAAERIDVAYRLELDGYFSPPRLCARVADARPSPVDA
jgi:single-stranded-DNA-specific exonuclease